MACVKGSSQNTFWAKTIQLEPAAINSTPPENRRGARHQGMDRITYVAWSLTDNVLTWTERRIKKYLRAVAFWLPCIRILEGNRERQKKLREAGRYRADKPPFLCVASSFSTSFNGGSNAVGLPVRFGSGIGVKESVAQWRHHRFISTPTSLKK